MIERDEAPRMVEIPGDLVEALRTDDQAAEALSGLSYSHQREYVEWITGAKRPRPAPGEWRKRSNG